mgnify:CR=1 FL=1
MELVVFHNPKKAAPDHSDLFAFALSDRLLAQIVWDRSASGPDLNEGGGQVTVAVPGDVQGPPAQTLVNVVAYDPQGGVDLSALNNGNEGDWFVVSNGKFRTKARYDRIKRHVYSLPSDIVLASLTPELTGYHEKLRITPQNSNVGWRRYYTDSIQLCETPDDWPHHVFIRTAVRKKIAPEGIMTLDFDKFRALCSAKSLRVISLRAAGRAIDLNTAEGLLTLMYERLGSTALTNGDGASGERGARIAGKVLFGRNVSVGDNAVFLGPAVVCDNASIGKNAIVKGTIIGPGVSIPTGAVVRDCIVNDTGEPPTKARKTQAECRKVRRSFLVDGSFEGNYFRTWPRWSYPRYFKRLFDIVIASVILLLFLPFFPVIAIMIKLSSAGPVFYRARRQGLGGKEFDCMKFRSMAPSAEGLQEKLSVVNQVDGPQFKLENDPRVNAVGRFLRDTNLDEIPQFINVLRGQMSVIGPRPSPEHENASSPHWRYARLSVRPGITGLWQICRTRREGRDFQEWVRYDTEYVRKLSFKLDLWIFWKTAGKLINDFVDRF